MSNWFNKESKKAWDESWKLENTISSAGTILGGLSGIIAPLAKNSQVEDTSIFSNNIARYNNAQFNTDNFNNLISDYSNNMIPSLPDREDLTLSTGKQIGNTLGGIASGAISGAQIGGPWGAVIGGALGLGSGIIGSITGNIKAKQQSDILDAELQAAKTNNINKFNYSAGIINDNMFNAAALNYRAFGGDLYDKAMYTKHYNNGKVKYRKNSYVGNLFSYGGQMKLAGDWSNGVTIIGEGGTHELNPYGGVQVGVDDKNVPNLVEEGEVIFNDYVYSNRLKPSDKQLDEVKLSDSFSGMTFADIAKKISEESQERPNDPISKNGLIDGMMKLQAVQEDIRFNKELQRFKREFKKLSPEEQKMVAEQMMQQDGQEQQADSDIQPYNFNDRYAMNGNPQEQLMSEYGEQNAFGGNLYPWGGNIDENGNPIINKDNPWNLSKEFIYYKNGQYDKGYLDWLNNYDFENSPHWDYLQKFYNSITGKNLTASKARRLGQDRQFGEFHRALGDLYTSSWAAPLPELDDNINTDFDFDFGDDDMFSPLDIESKSYTPAQRISFTERLRRGTNEALRYAPIIGSGIHVIGDLFGLNRPDYTNASMIGNAGNRIRSMRAPMLYNYLQYNPYDVNYEQNRLQNIGLGSQRNTLNTVSGNRSAALASLMLGNKTMMSGIGDMYRTAREYNDTQRKTVGEFNRGTDQINLQSILTASQANQNMDKYRADLITKEAVLRDQIDTATSAARSANFSNLFNNMGKVGQDIYYGNQADWYLKNVLPRNEQTRTYRIGKNGGKIRKPKRLI